MNNCVSKNSADFKSLYKEVFEIDNVDAGLEQILAVKISSWQDENGLDKWPLASDMRAQMTGQATMAYIKDKTSGKGLIKPGVAELFESNPELANSVYEALGLNNINDSEITYTDEEGNPCAEMGMRSSKFTRGSQWEIVKDLKGYPSHSQGGVDVKLGKNGFSFTRDNGVIEAKHGLVLSNNFENPIEFEAMSKVLSQRNKHLNWIDRGLNPDKHPKIDNQNGTFSTHRLAYSTGDNGEAYVYPTIIQNDKGELEQLDDKAAWEYAKKTKTAMTVPNAKLAEYYSKNGLIKH